MGAVRGRGGLQAGGGSHLLGLRCLAQVSTSVPALCQVDVFYFDIYRYLNLTDTKYFFPFTSGKMEIWTRGPTDELLM